MTTGEHTEHEDHGWQIEIPDHPPRTDSPEYVASRAKMHELADSGTFYAAAGETTQDHHGAGLWLKDADGWFLVKNLAGIEWSAQWCISCDVRVLTSGLRWVPAGEIRVGQELMGFDEESKPGMWRRWKPATVLAASEVRRPSYDLEFDDGTQVRASADHRWLVGQGGAHMNSSWVTTENLRADRGWTEAEDAELLSMSAGKLSVTQIAAKLGRSDVAIMCRRSKLRRGGPVRYSNVRSRVLRLTDVWSEDESRGAGYLAAAFDGEGCLVQVEDEQRGRGFGTRVTLEFAQRPNEMLDEVRQLLDERGFAYRVAADATPTSTVFHVTLRTRADTMRFLGSIRPLRLLAGFRPAALGTMQRIAAVTLVRKEFVGVQPVISLTTSTGTFVAEGLATHNCGDPARVDLLRANAARLYAAFPGAVAELGIAGLLAAPITDAAGVATWTDSICNASVPLPAALHTGVLPAAGGVHHYPTPVCLALGTPVLAATGWVPIQDVIPGSLVATRQGWKRVLGQRCTGVQAVMQVVVADRSITVTPSHLIATSTGWCEAQALTLGTPVYVVAGAAPPTAFRGADDVLGRELVVPDAVRLAGVQAEGVSASAGIDLARDGFQVSRVHAGAMRAGPPSGAVYVENDGVPVDQVAGAAALGLRSGFRVSQGDGLSAITTSVHAVNGLTRDLSPMPVFDLQVEDAHEFAAAGIIVHNCDIETFKYADFNLFVTDTEGHQAAVVPVAPRGSGDGRVQVLWANTGSQVHARHMGAQAEGRALILPADHELARLAFARQQ
jgi:uncharacterized protein DUF6424